MQMKSWVRSACASLATAALLFQPAILAAQDQKNEGDSKAKLVEVASRSSDASARGTHSLDDAPYLSHQQKVELIRHHIKYVFVIFHENESFDHYFGTFPGANGLFSAPDDTPPANQTPSFVQKYLDTSLHTVTISPFLMPQAVQTAAGELVPIYPTDLISVDHSHTGMSNGLGGPGDRCGRE